AAAAALALSVLLLGAIYPPAARRLALFPDHWIFTAGSFFWGPARALAALAVFWYQVAAFFLFLECLSPGTANQMTRLSAQVLGPVRRALPRPGPALLAWVAAFGALLALVRVSYVAAGLLLPPSEPLIRGWLSAAGALLGFSGIVVLLLIARAVLSFLPPAGPRGGMGYMVETLTDPILRPFRALNLRIDRWDLTPAAAIVAVLVARRLAELVLFRLYEVLP
ncbi:MAG TPA: YggT family protein, partial [bacterium]|nr:YggT family protein [bacterium]